MAQKCQLPSPRHRKPRRPCSRARHNRSRLPRLTSTRTAFRTFYADTTVPVGAFSPGWAAMLIQFIPTLRRLSNAALMENSPTRLSYDRRELSSCPAGLTLLAQETSTRTDTGTRSPRHVETTHSICRQETVTEASPQPAQ